MSAHAAFSVPCVFHVSAVNMPRQRRERFRYRRTKNMDTASMGWIAWIVLGLIAGFIASKIVNHTGSGILIDIVLGIVGAIAGGFLFSLFGAAGVTGFN